MQPAAQALFRHKENPSRILLAFPLSAVKGNGMLLIFGKAVGPGIIQVFFLPLERNLSQFHFPLSGYEPYPPSRNR